jgi:hypothetical protein
MLDLGSAPANVNSIANTDLLERSQQQVDVVLRIIDYQDGAVRGGHAG